MEMTPLTPFNLMQLLLTLVIAFVTSSGFWAYITQKKRGETFERKLLMGIAHDRMVYLATKYIERGYLTRNEYENLVEMLYRPYQEMGGNGTAKRLIDEVNKLNIRNHAPVDDSEITIYNKKENKNQ